MNPVEAATVLDFAIASGAWPNSDDDLKRDQAAAWTMVLESVPMDFAMSLVKTHQGPYSLKPSQIRGRWEEQQRIAARNTYSESECAWARVCRCTHTECMHGLMAGDLTTVTITVQGDRGQTKERQTQAVQWCPQCWEARNLIRSDHGKEFRTLGDLTP